VQCVQPYSRIANNGKAIKCDTNYRRSVKVCNEIREKYGLTSPSWRKQNVNRDRLQGKDKVRRMEFVEDECAHLIHYNDGTPILTPPCAFPYEVTIYPDAPPEPADYEDYCSHYKPPKKR
jgi:hypothetical protein